MPASRPEQPDELHPPQQLPLLKRWVARLLGRGLSRLNAQHRDSWFHGHAAGQRLGHAKGVRDGYDEGRVDGYEEGQQVLVIRDTRAPGHGVPGVDDLLFDDWRLPIDAGLKKRIKADVAQRLPAHSQPSAAQWKMIFSDTPSTCVVAGAGAGKSTTLALRILLLHHYLGFELAAMTVVTFTRESRKDFIKKLRQLFDLFELNISEKSAQELVRTFHSRILPLVRSLPSFAQLQAFENLGSRERQGEEADSNPFDLRLNDAQRQQLNLCYRDLCSASPRFAELVGALRLHSLKLKPLDRDHPDVQKRVMVTELSAQRDEELCDVIEDLWFAAGAWPIKGIEPSRQTLEINGSTFHVHGHIASLDAWVVLGCDPGESQQIKRNGAKLPVWAEWLVKRTLFQAFCDKPLIWMENYRDAKRLVPALAAEAVAGPGFDYKVKGELGSVPLLDAFVGCAGFIENLGLDVTAAVAGMSFAQDDSDRLFFEALSLYWKAFEQHLLGMTPPVMTYNRMFALFGENSPENLQRVADAHLRPLAHLMIDEFQDVSPQIVSWLRASLREIRRRSPGLQAGQVAQYSSLLCVGDDWQSIYGWRGSSPQYFMEFTQTFAAPSHTRVLLVENYRSQASIIEAAEHIVRATPTLPGKKARACAEHAEARRPVQVFKRDDADLGRRVVEHYRRGDSVLLLYRKSSDRALVAEHLGGIVEEDRAAPAEQRRFKQLTYHSAKGLQADAVFLVGDCQHLSSSPYKNQVYRLAGLGKPGDPQAFDKAQQEEALRLAYVGITRAAGDCYWYVEEAGKDTGQQPRASDQVDPAKACFDDQRRRTQA